MIFKEEDLIGAYCPSCKRETYFSYLGLQDLKNNHKLYTCGICASTFTEERIRVYSIEKAIELRELDMK